jgi:N-acyl homoserine lactone hydrolase
LRSRGDGTVVIKSTPGHTPGHQSLYLKLSQTGPVLISGDLYHYEAERALNVIPPSSPDKEGERASRARIEVFLKETGAHLWIQHSLANFRTLKKSPAYYE